MNIGVDIDLTLVRSDLAWWQWMCTVTQTTKDFEYPPTPSRHYNLGEYFEEEFKDLAYEPLDFWRGTNVYDDLYPIIHSREVLAELSEEGHSIYFISTIKGNHAKSKVEWVKRYFPFVAEVGNAILLTKEKYAVNCDIMIDDRNTILNSMGECAKIKMWTPYLQDAPETGEITTCYSWGEIEKIIGDYRERDKIL